MKIVLWSSQSLPEVGGIEVMVQSLALEYIKEGHSVIVISTNSYSKEYEKKVIDGVTIHTFAFRKCYFEFNLKEILSINQRILKIIDDFSPDIVNIHGWYEDLAFYQEKVLRSRPIPICLTVHGLIDQDHYKTKSCLKIWDMASHVNTVSNALIETLEKTHMHHPNLSCIYNGISISNTPIRRISTTHPTLVMVGRLSVEKSYETAFYALKLLIKKYPSLKLILVGGGDEFDKLSNLRESLKLTQSIEMTNFVHPESVEHYLDKASLVLIPSTYESFSLVAVHAAIRQKCVIASDVVGLKEVIVNNVTGILIGPENPEVLASTIHQLFKDHKKIESLSYQAQKRARELFSIEKSSQNYLKLYQNALESCYATTR